MLPRKIKHVLQLLCNAFSSSSDSFFFFLCIAWVEGSDDDWKQPKLLFSQHVHVHFIHFFPSFVRLFAAAMFLRVRFFLSSIVLRLASRALLFFFFIQSLISRNRFFFCCCCCAARFVNCFYRKIYCFIRMDWCIVFTFNARLKFCIEMSNK